MKLCVIYRPTSLMLGKENLNHSFKILTAALDNVVTCVHCSSCKTMATDTLNVINKENLRDALEKLTMALQSVANCGYCFTCKHMAMNILDVVGKVFNDDEPKEAY